MHIFNPVVTVSGDWKHPSVLVNVVVNCAVHIVFFSLNSSVKGIFQPFELGGETILIRSAVKHRCLASKKIFFNDTNSREEHKTN
jgi:hypothetical protein